jgi:hypothetical protein
MGVLGPAPTPRAGIDVNELERQFVLQEARARDYVYGVAVRIKESQESAN